MNDKADHKNPTLLKKQGHHKKGDTPICAAKLQKKVQLYKICHTFLLAHASFLYLINLNR